MFNPEFSGAPKDKAEASKAKKAHEGRINDLLTIRDGWVNDLLLLRNEKSHITGVPFSDHQGERFLVNASALLRSAGADAAASVLHALLKDLHQSREEEPPPRFWQSDQRAQRVEKLDATMLFVTQ